MSTKETYKYFAVFVAFIFSIVLFTDASVEKIEILNTTNLTTNDVEIYRQTVSAKDQDAHCEIGQLFLDGKYIEKDYEKAFFHLFLCDKIFSWTSSGQGRESLRSRIFKMETTYKQFVPVFKSQDIDQKMISARHNALIHVKTSKLASFDKFRIKGRINRTFIRASNSYLKVSSGKTYRGLIFLMFAIFILIFLFNPPVFRKNYAEFLKKH